MPLAPSPPGAAAARHAVFSALGLWESVEKYITKQPIALMQLALEAIKIIPF
jgi:hypothetical protein